MVQRRKHEMNCSSMCLQLKQRRGEKVEGSRERLFKRENMKTRQVKSGKVPVDECKIIIQVWLMQWQTKMNKKVIPLPFTLWNFSLMKWVWQASYCQPLLLVQNVPSQFRQSRVRLYEMKVKDPLFKTAKMAAQLLLLQSHQQSFTSVPSRLNGVSDVLLGRPSTYVTSLLWLAVCLSRGVQRQLQLTFYKASSGFSDLCDVGKEARSSFIKKRLVTMVLHHCELKHRRLWL